MKPSQYIGQPIQCIDVHTAGEPLRIITSGYPDLPGETVLEKRAWAKTNADDLRKLLMLEPRGHADMYGCILTPPASEDGDVGVLFLHNEGYSTMCGHGIIGLMKAGLEFDLFRVKDKTAVVRIDTPAGRVRAQAHWHNGAINSVSFWNVPSFVLESDLTIESKAFGKVHASIAFGGAFYLYVDASQFSFKLDGDHYSEIISAGKMIKTTAMQQCKISHPVGDHDLNFLYGVIFVGEAHDSANHSRNVCVFADGEVDRSPTGTGVSGRAAIHAFRNEIRPGETIRIESIIGTTFEVTVDSEAKIGELSGIVPKVTGSAFVTGRHEFFVDENDPVNPGFLLR